MTSDEYVVGQMGSPKPKIEITDAMVALVCKRVLKEDLDYQQTPTSELRDACSGLWDDMRAALEAALND